jgi:hypothetical protein
MSVDKNKKLPKKLGKEELEGQYRERNIKLLDLGGRDAKVLIANTIESKELLSKFIRVDAISKKSRELVGNKLSIENFTELNQKFTAINKLFDEIIEFGTGNNLFFDPKAQKFSTMKPKLVQLIKDGKDTSAISRELNVNIKKVESWIKLLDSENSEKVIKSVDITKVPASSKAAAKTIEKDTEKVS